MNITVIGAGNGGQAMAGHFALLGNRVTLFARNIKNIPDIVHSSEINLQGEIEGVAKLHLVTDNAQQAIKDAEIIMVVTTADAHRTVGRQIAPFLKRGQTIILNPGRTMGALEFSNEVRSLTDEEVYIAEAQSLVYACRASSKNVKIIGIKSKILLAALPAVDTDLVLDKVNSVYDCFIKADNTLVTGMENIGAMFHPAITLFNTERIEKGEKFLFYNDITPAVARFITRLDAERLKIGSSYGLKLHSVSQWIGLAYATKTDETLYQAVRNNVAYNTIEAPEVLISRYLMEDVPTGILPMIELAKVTGVETPLLSSIFNMAQTLVAADFTTHGRTLANLKLTDKTALEILAKL